MYVDFLLSSPVKSGVCHVLEMMYMVVHFLFLSVRRIEGAESTEGVFGPKSLTVQSLINCILGKKAWEAV